MSWAWAGSGRFPELDCVHCMERAGQMIWAALLHFPDENLTESRHGECCCVLTNGLTNGRCQEGAGGWRGSHFSPWEHFRKKKKKLRAAKRSLSLWPLKASFNLTRRTFLFFVRSYFIFYLIGTVNYQ